MVDALLDIPGHTARTWNAPTFNACIGVISSMFLTALFFLFLKKFSTISNKNPPTNNPTITD